MRGGIEWKTTGAGSSRMRRDAGSPVLEIASQSAHGLSNVIAAQFGCLLKAARARPGDPAVSYTSAVRRVREEE